MPATPCFTAVDEARFGGCSENCRPDEKPEEGEATPEVTLPPEDVLE
ncbi:hypothetical protein GCM10020220_028780 [Nonomuraea rubra]